VSIGGDGSLSIAQQMFDHGIPVVGVPKTIDNDVGGTVLTFGFMSAVDCVTQAIDKLHTTAESHSRVMVLEVMGRYAGWLAIFGGIAGGADVILIPEIPFSFDAIVAKIREREARNKHFTLVVVAEGAREKDHAYVESAARPENREARLGGIGAAVSAEIEQRTGKESRVCVLGHLQRGGTPSPFDRALCSMFGTEAMELVVKGEFGKMVTYLGTHVGAIPIAHAVAKLKNVPPDGDMAVTARALGVCLGD
jgi:6-phosphofructokinase 1